MPRILCEREKRAARDGLFYLIDEPGVSYSAPRDVKGSSRRAPSMT